MDITSKTNQSNNEASVGNWNYERFYDEVYRVENYGASPTAWTSENTLTIGNAAVVNGKLYHKNYLTGTTGDTTNNIYYRIFTPPQPTGGGQIQWTSDNQYSSPFKDLSPSSEDGIGNLQMSLHIQNDNNIYDLGRPVGNNFIDANGVSYKGIRDSVVNSSRDQAGINFSFVDGGEASATNKVILLVRFNIDNDSRYIDEIKLRFN